jgi:hypothetical protein
VLLLRAAGVPTRYATGYAIQEFSELEGSFVVRSRHAHAWARVFLDGRWQDFDTTPPSWMTVEAQSASPLQPLYDFWSWIACKFAEWRWRESEGGATRHVGWLLIPLLLLLVYRLRTRKRVQRTTKKEKGVARVLMKQGEDSPFYEIERQLRARGYVRYPWEPLSAWLTRIGDSPDTSAEMGPLASILALHYGYRFDPKGITEEEKRTLDSKVRAWLERTQKSDKVPIL